MQAITTKYLSATNTRGSRIKASAGKGQSITIGYDHGATCAHRVAAIALINKLDWCGDLVWCEGGTETGYVYVAVSRTYTTGDNGYNMFTVEREQV